MTFFKGERRGSPNEQEGAFGFHLREMPTEASFNGEQRPEEHCAQLSQDIMFVRNSVVKLSRGGLA
jgi:hypothetical protein